MPCPETCKWCPTGFNRQVSKWNLNLSYTLSLPYKIQLFGEGSGDGDDDDDDDDDDDNNNNNKNTVILKQFELKLNSINYYGGAAKTEIKYLKTSRNYSMQREEKRHAKLLFQGGYIVPRR